MTDLIRLMFDDGATRKSPYHHDSSVVAYVYYRDKKYRAVHNMELRPNGLRCWYLNRDRIDDSSHNMNAFLADPSGFVNHWMGSRMADPGFRQHAEPSTENDWCLIFEVCE